MQCPMTMIHLQEDLMDLGEPRRDVTSSPTTCGAGDDESRSKRADWAFKGFVHG